MLPHLEKVFLSFHFTLSRLVASSEIRTFVIGAADFLSLFGTEAEAYENVGQVVELSGNNTTFSAKVAMQKKFKQSIFIILKIWHPPELKVSHWLSEFNKYALTFSPESKLDFVVFAVIYTIKTHLVGGFNPLKNISQNGNLLQIGMKIKIFETTTWPRFPSFLGLS